MIVVDEPFNLPDGTQVRIDPLTPVSSSGAGGPRRDWKGLYRNTGPVPTEEDIRALREEIWPRP